MKLLFELTFGAVSWCCFLELFFEMILELFVSRFLYLCFVQVIAYAVSSLSMCLALMALALKYVA